MGDTTALTGVNRAPGHRWARRRCLPHVVLPLNRHVHLVHSALRNGPRRNQQTHPWEAQKQTGTQTGGTCESGQEDERLRCHPSRSDWLLAPRPARLLFDKCDVRGTYGCTATVFPSQRMCNSVMCVDALVTPAPNNNILTCLLLS